MNCLRRFPMSCALFLALALVIGTLTTLAYLKKGSIIFADKVTSIPVQAFSIVKGQGKKQDDALIIHGYQGGRAVVSNFTRIKNVHHYRYVYFQLSPDKLIDEPPSFFWRSAETGKLYNITLEEELLDHLDMKDIPGWQGDISEYGFIFNESTARSWKLKYFAFTNDTLFQSILHTLSSWLEFEVWSQHSVNFIYGGAARKPVSLTLLVACTVLTTLLVYSLLLRLGKQPPDSSTIATLLLSGWLLLDGRWLFDLYRQVRLTHDSFAGKSLAEQYETGLDGRYYRFFEHLRKDVLPVRPQFIYVLDNTTDYYRAKTPWFLAPHNVFNLDSYPRAEYARKGGYVLILHPVTGLTYDPSSSALRWGAQDSLKVSPVYIDPLGALYKILPLAN